MAHALPSLTSDVFTTTATVRAIWTKDVIPAGSLAQYIERIPVRDRRGRARTLVRFLASTDGGESWWFRQTLDEVGVRAQP